MKATDLMHKAYEAHADAIFRHCYFRLFNRERALDAMQQTFTKTWEYLVKGGEIENIRAFLYTTATHVIIDEVRKKREMVSLDGLEEKGWEPSVDEQSHVEDHIDGGKIRACLQQLEPSYRDALVMRYVDDLAPKEISKILGETQNVISVRINRGMKKLRNLLPESYV